jgi:hypothetical protein
MTFEIKPYIGAGVLAFGISQSQAEAHLGKATWKIENEFPSGELLDYPGISLAFDLDGRLTQIGFDKHFSGVLQFEDVDVLRAPNAFEVLTARDGNPYVWVGFVMLLNLGMRLGGYDDPDEGRTVSLFGKGRYDSKIGRFQPLNK